MNKGAYMRTAIKTAAAAAVFAGFLTAPAHALDWRLGVAYASGLSDVTDLYEDNLRLAGFDADVSLRFPLGVAAGITYDWENNVRFDAGVGPVFLIGGDIKHSEVPISATVGYSFNRLEPISPFVRAGLVHHFVDGDQYKSSSPGPLVAVGVDFTHIIVELSWDDSDVTFDKLNCNASGAQCSLGETTLNTYEYLLGVYWRFR
jgi:hypothetical protein